MAFSKGRKLELDKTLVENFKSGDVKSFEQIFNALYKVLVNYAQGMLRDWDEAEDKVQQVFVNLWEKKEVLDVHTSLRAYLYKAVHNACLNRIKQEKVRTEHAKVIQMTQNNNSTQHGVEEKELRLKIDEALNLLPEQCGRIFKMSRFDQLKYQEIADELGLSLKTIENQMTKALRIMREQLKDHLPQLILLLNSILLA